MRIVNNNPAFGALRTTSRLQRLGARISDMQDQAITGLKVRSPADAPGAWGQIHGLRSELEDQSAYGVTMGRAHDLLDVADGVLGTGAELMRVAIERAVQFANPQYDAAARANAAAEVAVIRDQMVGIANTRLGERSLFAGDAYDTDAFDATGAYQGESATQTARIGRNTDVALAFDGSELFGAAGGTDVFQALTDLEAALTANDPDAVSATLDTLYDAHRQLVDARETVGRTQDRVMDAQVLSETIAARLDARLTEATNADPIETYNTLMSLAQSYEAALQVTARTSGAKLFDMLR